MSAITHFLEKISETETSIPPSSQWALIIEGPNGRRIPNIVTYDNAYSDEYKFNSLEGGEWKIPISNSSNIATKSHAVLEDGEYCYFCRGVKVPGENMDLGTVKIGAEGMHRGYLPGIYAKGRQYENVLSTTFFETNISFIDHIIRPWIIRVTHQGLLAYPINDIRNIKVNLSVVWFSMKDFGIRKTYTYFSACPIKLSEADLSYQGEKIQTYTVDWAFNKYSIKLGG